MSSSVVHCHDVVSKPENRHSKHYDCVVLSLINVVHHPTKSDLSYDDWRMMWSMVYDCVAKHLKIV